MSGIEEVVAAWQPHIDSIENWEDYVADVVPKETPCGPVYELPNPIDRPNESFAIADMRNLKYAEPHYHINGETEIYFVLQGLGLAVVGRKEQHVGPGDIIVTPPHTSHFIIPERNLVIAVVNTPPFNPLNVVVNTHTDTRVGFDEDQFNKLTRSFAA